MTRFLIPSSAGISAEIALRNREYYDELILFNQQQIGLLSSGWLPETVRGRRDVSSDSCNRHREGIIFAAQSSHES